MLVARLVKDAGISVSFGPVSEGSFRRDVVKIAVSRSICLSC